MSGGSGDDLLVGGEGSDRLLGGSGSDLFLFLDENTGRDAIVGFGQDDVFVTIRPIRDGNGDGIIAFGSNRRVDFGASTSASIMDEAGRTVTSLEYDGSYSDARATYFVYSRVGSDAGVAAVAAHGLANISLLLG